MLNYYIKLKKYLFYLFKKIVKKKCIPYQKNTNFIIPILKKELRNDIVTILDIGCGMLYENNSANKTEDIMLSCFDNKLYRITGIDISEACINWRKKFGPKGEYFVMDARNLNSLTKRFDFILAHHVIEHITKDEGITLLKNLEKLAIKQIVIGTPIGFVDTEYAVSLHNNEYERHLSGWKPNYFEKRGYKIYQDSNVFIAIKNISN